MLQRALVEHAGEEPGNSLFQRFDQSFPAAYKEDFTARTAVSDILRLHRICPDYPLDMRLYRSLEDPEGVLRFKVFGPEKPIPLSDVLTKLEHMGLRILSARPYEIVPHDDTLFRVLDFDMRENTGIQVDAPLWSRQPTGIKLATTTYH